MGTLLPNLLPARLRAWRRQLRGWARALRARHWFPHIVLALGLAGAGLLLLTLVYGSLGRLWRDLPSRLLAFPAASMPFLLIGVAMLIMSVGLVLRSRFAWVTGLVLTATALFLVVMFHHGQPPLLVEYDAVLLLLLVLAYPAFNRSSLAAGTLFALTSALLLLIYAVFGSLYIGDQFAPHIADPVTALYYAVVTMGTVGYGDIVPATPHAKLFTVSVIILGIAVFATSVTAVIGPLVTGNLERFMARKEKPMNRSGHFIIAGATPLAFNTYQELKRRQQVVTLILPQPATGPEADPADVIVGDATSLDVLRRAHAESAQAVLAMRADDSENTFIALAVKELKGKAKTVVIVNDSKHLERVQLVQPDLVIAPQVLGGEMLAMALTGERISADFILNKFLHSETRPEV